MVPRIPGIATAGPGNLGIGGNTRTIGGNPFPIMKTSAYRSSAVWTATFFATLGAFSVGYSAFVPSMPSPVTAGSGLSSTEWNRMVAGLQGLDAALSNFSFSGANVGIGTATPDHRFHLSGDMRLDTGSKIRFGSFSEGTDDIYLKRVNPASDQSDLRLYVHDNSQDEDRFSIWGNSCGGGACSVESAASVRHWFATSGNAWHAGAVNATAFNNTSDARLKTDVRSLTGSLDAVSRLRGVSFEWKDARAGTGTQIGFVAQEVERVLPDLVRTGPDGYESVQYANMTAVLVEAVKELREENRRMREENADLARRLEILESGK